MDLKNLKNLRYSNMLVKISVGMSSSYSTVDFVIAQLTINASPNIVTYTNRDGTFKKFRSLPTLYRFLNEVRAWEIHPDLEHLDQLVIKPEILVL